MLSNVLSNPRPSPRIDFGLAEGFGGANVPGRFFDERTKAKGITGEKPQEQDLLTVWSESIVVYRAGFDEKELRRWFVASDNRQGLRELAHRSCSKDISNIRFA